MTDDFVIYEAYPKIDHIEFRPSFSVICAVGGRPFSGHILIAYEPFSFLLEFERFEKWLAALAQKEFTVESLCQFVYEEIWKQLHPTWLTVTVRAELSSSHAYAAATKQNL